MDEGNRMNGGRRMEGTGISIGGIRLEVSQRAARETSM